MERRRTPKHFQGLQVQRDATEKLYREVELITNYRFRIKTRLYKLRRCS